ncbi:MAG: class I SAM-dependent methyltransferase [Ruminococcus flavefaciens]|nr:class I SAM-dependent methyltransferase [Ruminococcus flavefaciens]
MKNRIYGEKVNINYNRTLEFFENRGGEKKLGTKYNYVLFQDDAPDIAIKRDIQEKDKICRLLSWNKEERVLDIGCGIGRWGEAVLEKGLEYTGIDYSKKLLGIADGNLKEFGGNKLLLYGSFQKLKEVLSQNGFFNVFQKVFINGVMMYINDADLEEGLENVISVCDEHCEIYLKESMATDERLTLNDFYSDSLTQDYTAIYRSIAEYGELVKRYFVENGFKIKEEGALFEETLQNRKETLDYYFVLKR